MNWKTILRLLAVLTVLIVLSYATMDYRKIEKEEKKEAGEEHSQAAEPKEKFWFLKNAGFLLAVGTLFFYMGLENSVNGWFVTYLKSTGFMSASLATVMVSVTWDHDHDRKDRHCKRLKEGAAGKDPGGDLHTAVRVGVDPRPRE